MSDEPRRERPRDSSADSWGEASDADRTPNTLLNALIGGIAGVLLAFIPFSTVLGGGVAGYLEGGDSRSGAKVGALAGLIVFVPFVAIIAIGLFIPIVPPGGGAQLAVWVTVLVIALVAALYTVGLSLVGGILGVYLKENR